MMNLGVADSTPRRSYVRWAVVLAFAGIAVGCKKLPDQALVVFKVEVASSVQGFTTLEFSVDGRKDVPSKTVTNQNDDHRTFQFGYYMPGVNGMVTIHGRALDKNGCVMGEGTLNASDVKAGQTSMTGNTLQIKAVTSSCADAASPPPDGGGSGTGGTQGTDGGPSDAGGMAGDGMTGDGSSVVVTGKQADGKACGTSSDCQSGYCTDGVCCNEACTGTCKACAATYTGGMDGVCANASPGASSRGACPNETSMTPCGHDGTCDGTGQCRFVTAGQTCGQATCADAHTFQPEAMCDGAGVCKTAATMDCGMYACATTGCAKPCTVATDCTAAQYCSNGTCKVKKSLGTMCAAAPECGSGFCSPDQVCCDKACTDACTACVKSSTGQTDGTCAPVQMGLKHNSDCAAEPETSCGKDGTCDGKGGCHLYGNATSCMPGSCSGSTFNPAKTCNASGMCTTPGTPMDCGQNACTTAGCSSSCKADADCGSSGYCDKTTTKCASKKSNGSPCGVGNECTSGACVDGVCCNTACTGTCVSCLVAKTGATNGMCTFIKAGMPDSRCTASDKSTCGQDGSCDGSGQCEKWPSSTVCAPSTCSTTNFLAARTCSQGACSPAAQTACGGAVCDPTSGCRSMCTSNTDCTGNNYCDTGTKKCTPLKANGQSCGTDGKQCMSGMCVDGVCCNAKCDGQCQSCSTGTCSNVKTPRNNMPCGGSPPCGGSCDGSSASCTFPGSTISCGPTGCASPTSTYVAGHCNSSGGSMGTCTGATTKACDPAPLCMVVGACVASTGACPAPTPVPNGSDPKNECADGTCRTGTCDGSGACGVTPNGQSGPGCSGANRCSVGDLVLGSSCQNGSCQGGGTKSCGYKGCANDQCRGTCPDRTNDTGSQCQPCGQNTQPCCTQGDTCNDLSTQICRSNENRCGTCSTTMSIGDSCCGVQRTYPDGLFATEKGTCPSPGDVCQMSTGTSPGWFCAPP